MIKKFTIILSNVLLLALVVPASQAEGLGRLFTTQKQRAMLERLRNPAPKPPAKTYEPIVTVDHSTFEPPASKYQNDLISQYELYNTAEKVIENEPEREVVVIPAPEIPRITVNGFVKRSGGRSTAWVNGMNTNDGYFEPQHIKVNPHRIGRDHVHVEVDDINIGDVSLKVGQTLDPEEPKITDSYQKMLGNTNK